MKTWRRAWKLELIERFNPTWRDLFEDLNQQKKPGPRLSAGRAGEEEPQWGNPGSIALTGDELPRDDV